MKNIKIYLTLIFVLNLFSCSDDALELNPLSSLTTEVFYQSEKDFDSGVIGLYATFKAVTMQWMRFEFRCDNMQFLGGGVPSALYNNNWTVDNTQDTYNFLYSLINRSNVVLDKIEGASFSQELIDQYKGEALYFKGWAYFNFVKIFGGAQIIPFSASIEDYSTTPRSDIQDTYNQAEKDLMDAISLLPDNYDSNNYGRITRYGAQGILARLYLQKTGWPLFDDSGFTKAKLLLKDIIDNSDYEFYPDFYEIFTLDQEKGKEILFSVIYSLNDGNLLSGLINWMPSIPEPGNTSLWTIPEQSFFDSFEKGDIRRDVSIDSFYYDRSGNLVRNLNVVKYLTDGYIAGRGFELDMPVIRFTDILLMYAEAVCGEDKKVQPEGAEIINQIRARAGLPSIEIADYDSFRNVLLKERRNEFFMEMGLRWFDLIRFGKVVEALEINGKNADETWYLLPIPPGEIERSPILTQNPGYI